MQDSTARPRLDDQQRLAVETLDRSVAVVAGAGTGKTTVLVERFIALLDANPDWPITAVVAITFTESAAEEMRSRVRQRILQRISTAKGEDRRRWAEHLSRIEATRISTIHGLCSEVIRANAAAVGVDPGFQVADEASAAVLMKDALAIALRDFAGADPETGDPNAAAAQEVLTRYDRTDVEEVLLSAKQYAGLEPPPAAVDTIEAMFERAAESRIAEICASDAARDILSIDAPPAADKQGSLVLAAQASLRAAADPDIPTAEKVASLKAL
ncbi:MAG: UvrD-helicase domain-containing protein, partial [Phototrophicaceae bacterium]